MTPPRLLSRQQAADTLGISTRTLDRLAAEAKIAHVRVAPRAVKYHPAELERYIRAQTLPREEWKVR